jgi:hypothetical protein
MPLGLNDQHALQAIVQFDLNQKQPPGAEAKLVVCVQVEGTARSWTCQATLATGQIYRLAITVTPDGQSYLLTANPVYLGSTGQ